VRTILVRCIHGLEWLCAEEIGERFPGADRIEISRREVTFRVPALDPELAGLRRADDAFLEVGRAGGAGTSKDVPAALAATLARLPWQERVEELRVLRKVPREPGLDVVASLEGARRYNRFAVENELGQVLSPILGARYLRRTASGREPGEPALTARIFVRGQSAIATLRLTAAPLHRREYKLQTGPGTLHPPAAAALAALAIRDHDQAILDPFCGDGTIGIEAALSHPGLRVLAGDVDPQRLDNAAGNAARAGVRLDLTPADAGHPRPSQAPVDAVLTNPPWNLAVDASGSLTKSLDPFWRQVPDLLTDDGRLALLADTELDVPFMLRRRGFSIGLSARIRLSGRMTDLVLAAPRQPAPALRPSATRWRERSVSTGVLTEDGF
jgi:23S rRNA G2445 N2-methylase RlmL